MRRRAYQTDLSDAEWSYIQPHLATPQAPGRPRVHSLREILDAIFYIVRSGCARTAKKRTHCVSGDSGGGGDDDVDVTILLHCLSMYRSRSAEGRFSRLKHLCFYASYNKGKELMEKAAVR